MSKLWIFGIVVLAIFLIPSVQATNNNCANLTLTTTGGFSQTNNMNMEPYYLYNLNGTNISAELRVYDDGNCVGNILSRDVVWYNDTAAQIVFIANFTIAGGASKNVSIQWDNGFSDPAYNRIRICYDNFSVQNNISGNCGWTNISGTQGWAGGKVWLYTTSGYSAMNTTSLNMSLPGKYSICGTFGRLAGGGMANDIVMLENVSNPAVRHLVGGAGGAEPYYCGGTGCTDLGSVTYNQSGERMCLHINGTAAGQGRAVWMPDTNGTRSVFTFNPDDTPTWGTFRIEALFQTTATNTTWDNITIYNETEFNEYNKDLAYVFYAPEAGPDTNPPDPAFVSPTLNNNSYTANNSWIYINVSASEALDTCILDYMPSANGSLVSLNNEWAMYNTSGTVSYDGEHTYFGHTYDAPSHSYYRGFLLFNVSGLQGKVIDNATLNIRILDFQHNYDNITVWFRSNHSLNYNSTFCNSNRGTCWNNTIAPSIQVATIANISSYANGTWIQINITSDFQTAMDNATLDQDYMLYIETSSNASVVENYEWGEFDSYDGGNPSYVNYTGDWVNQTMTSDAGNKYCTYNLTGLTNQTAYYFRVYANDTAGNLNVTEDRQITINLSDEGITPTLPQPTWVTPATNATATSIKYQLMNWTGTSTASSGKIEWCNTSCVNYSATCSGKYCYLNMSQTANLTYVVARGYITNGSGENVTQNWYINFSNQQTPGNCTRIANINHTNLGEHSIINLTTGDWNLEQIWDCIENNQSLQQTSSKVWFLNANITVSSGATLWLNDSDIVWLKINSSGAGATASNNHVINGSGRLMINNTKITSWNSVTNSFDTGSVIGSDARSYIVMSSYGGMHYVENSNVSYLGWSLDDSGYYKSQGLEFEYTQLWYDNNSGTGMRTGITLYRGYNSTIKNSVQTYAGDDDGFFIYISNTTLVHNNNCTGNHISACIQVADSNNCTITDNYASDTTYGFWIIGNYWNGGYYNLIANNTAVGNTYGFAVEYGGYYQTYRNNTAYNNDYGFWTNIAPSNTTGCSPCTQTGFVFENNTIRNNTISNVKIGVPFTNTRWNWNSIYGPGTGYNFDNSQTATVNATYNDWWFYTNASIEAELNQNSGTIYYYPFLGATESTLPQPYIIEPANGTNVSTKYLFINASDNATVTSCQLNWNNGSAVNYTMSAAGKSCSINISQSQNTTVLWFVYIQNSTGWNVSKTMTTGFSNLQQDTDPPDITWNSPASNNTFTNNVSWIYWNVTVSETPNACLLNYGTAGEVDNFTMTIDGSYCYYNGTDLANQSMYCGFVYANDSSGNMNASETRCATINLSQGVTPTLPQPYFVSPTPANGTKIEVKYQLFNWTDYNTASSGKLWINTTNTNYSATCSGKYCYYNYTYSSNISFAWKAYITNGTGENVTNGGWAYFEIQGESSSLPQPYFISPANGTNVTTKYLFVNASDYSTVTGCKLEWDNGTATNYTMTIGGKYCYINISQDTNTTVLYKVYVTNASGENVTAEWSTGFQIQYPDTSLYSFHIIPYDEVSLARIYNFTVEFITSAGSKFFGINTTFLSNVSDIINPSFLYDRNSSSFAYVTTGGAANYTMSGRMFVGDSNKICAKWNISNGVNNVYLWLYAKNASGWNVLGFANIAPSSSESRTDCITIAPASYDNMVDVNVTMETFGGATVTAYLFEAYPITHNLSNDALTINQSLLVNEDDTRIDVADVAGLYYERSYIEDVNQDGNITVTAYLPPKSSTVVQSVFIVKNQWGSAISSASLTVKKNIGGTYTTIGSMTTDDTGTASFYLIENAPYRLTVVSGSTTLLYSFTALAQTYYITMNESLEVNYTALFDDIFMSVGPAYISYNGSLTSYDQKFTLNISSNKSLLTNFGVMLFCNGTYLLNMTNVSEASGGLLEITEDIAACDNITMSYYFEKSGYGIWWKDQIYQVLRGSGYGLWQAIRLFQGGFSADVQVFVFIIVLVIIGSALVAFGPEGSIVASLVAFGVFVYMDSGAAAPLGLSGIFIVISLASLGMIAVKRRWI